MIYNWLHLRRWRTSSPLALHSVHMENQEPQASTSHEDVRFNATVNILDGAFFGAGLGFASFTTIIPLFVSLLTSSPIIIGLAPAIHSLGWQLPQLPLAGRVAKLSRFKPSVLTMTIHERLPFLGLAITAWFFPSLNPQLALAIVFLLLVWQGFGGGFTANLWQSMIAKIIPESMHGRFFGLQMAGMDLLMSGAAVAAGVILERNTSRVGFSLNFTLAFAAMVVSFIFLSLTREKAVTPARSAEEKTSVWWETRRLLGADSIFRRFLLIRMIFQLGMVAFSFYAIYAVADRGVGVGLVGVLTGVMVFSQMAVNPMLGAIGDRTNHFFVLFLGTITALLSTLLIGYINSVSSLYLSFSLAGIALAVGWTTTIVISLGFGRPAEQSTYIGMSNTLIAPVTLAAPFVAGWVIGEFGYPSMFRACALIFLLAALMSLSMLRERARIKVIAASDTRKMPEINPQV
jgi:MFS family permease